jgi:hypothetical protein
MFILGCILGLISGIILTITAKKIKEIIIDFYWDLIK